MKINIARLAITLGISLTGAIISFALLEVNPMPLVLILALLVTLVNYFFGELVIRRHLATFITAALKGLMAVLLAWIMGAVIQDFTVTPSAQVVFGFLVGGLEMIF